VSSLNSIRFRDWRNPRGPVAQLPVSIHWCWNQCCAICDGNGITNRTVAAGKLETQVFATEEIPFVVARIVLQDFTGVAVAGRSGGDAFGRCAPGRDPKIIEPLVAGGPGRGPLGTGGFLWFAGGDAKNLEMEFQRNRERYQFLKWGMQAFDTFKVVPPGIGIVHPGKPRVSRQRRSFLSVSSSSAQLFFPDTLVGTDFATRRDSTAWVSLAGVRGRIEAEAGMLGQPVLLSTPTLSESICPAHWREGVTATDLALTVTQMLRKAKVVGKFVEFFGPGAAALPVVDPRHDCEHGARIWRHDGLFIRLMKSGVNYLRATGRSEGALPVLMRIIIERNSSFGMPAQGQIQYFDGTRTGFGLSGAKRWPGRKRPQDRIDLPKLKQEFVGAFTRPIAEMVLAKSPEELSKSFQVAPAQSVHAGGGSQEPVSAQAAASRNTNPLTELEMTNNRPTPNPVMGQAPNTDGHIRHGSVLIAAITSCTNTSNPSVMLAAGLLARKAVERRAASQSAGQDFPSRPARVVVSDYLN